MREMGDCDRSDRPDESFPDVRRCWERPMPIEGSMLASGWAAGRPTLSPACEQLGIVITAVLLLRTFLRPALPVLTRLRLLMTSVLSEMGRGRPCSFRKSPQALHRTDPASSRLHKGVVLVEQFWHTGCAQVSNGTWGVVVLKCSYRLRDKDKQHMSRPSNHHSSAPGVAMHLPVCSAVRPQSQAQKSQKSC